MTIQELKEKINKDFKERKQIKITNGAFGDMENCAGLVEEIIKPETGGTFTKFYGCSKLLKGNIDVNLVKELGMAKAMISSIPREILIKSFLFKSVLILMAIFSRKRFYYYLKIYSEIIINNFFSSFPLVKIPEKQWGDFTKELKRALEYSLQKNNSYKTDIGEFFKNLGDFIYIFMEADTGYRFPAQDTLPNLNKENLRKSFYEELNRLLLIPIKRTNHENQYNKYIYIRKVILMSMILPEVRNIFKDFLLELNLDKIRLDDDDWYFCLQRKHHNYKGWNLQDRIREKQRIDIECKHILLEFHKKENV